ncbi:MAG: hypothetical protein A3G18_06465 [Rhodospirillales bacterium RIFCSPLOWO2_12_FULL_58_28]|nr:MAG: hypothetical protein A3H92_02020 [Rhodospirillales bacterium RIFCSPLOWO2_02_FULL_58_16]OHC78633.1 MAG: hypothetical protein A3G18_06465 [Rhodospirillales bacterium RIFCSPLOWO2_12_FULL_58_28]
MRARTAFDLGLIIRERRRKLGIDQRELADKVGVSRQWVVEIEKGKPRAEVGLLLRTLEALDLKLNVENEASEGIGEGGGAGSWDFNIDDVVDEARGKKR